MENPSQLLSDEQERLEEIQFESLLCHLLALLLDQPDSSFQERLNQWNQGISLLEGQVALPEIDSIDRLLVEYTRLFLGPFQIAVPSSSSLYLTENTRILMGDSTGQAMEFYREGGLTWNSGRVPDHIATEISFLSYLLRREAESLERRDATTMIRWSDLALRFIDEHAIHWFDSFAKRLALESEHPFYTALSGSITPLLLSIQEDLIRRRESSQNGTGTKISIQ